MNRWLLIGSLAALLVGSTGCLHHNVRKGCSDGACASGACNECNNGSCGNGCNNCSNGSGLFGQLGANHGACGNSGCRNGCVAGPIGWQQGGLDYSSHLQPGLLGHQAASHLQNRPFIAGPPTAQSAYPYYTVRGPRDFFLDNPPTIGR